MKKSIEDIIKAARTEPVQIPFQEAVATAKQRIALLSLKSSRFQRIRTFLTGVIVGILLASLSFGYFVNRKEYNTPTIRTQNILLQEQNPSGTNNSVRDSNTETGTNNLSNSHGKALQHAATTIRYITRYIVPPTPLPDFFRQPSWTEESQQKRQMRQYLARDNTTSNKGDKNTSALTKEYEPAKVKNAEPLTLSSFSSLHSAINLHSDDVNTPQQSMEKPFEKNIFGQRDIPSNTILEEISTFKEHFSIGMRGITTLYAQKPSSQSLVPDRYFLENAVMYASYKLSKNTTVGIEVGYDTYYQRFKTLDLTTNIEYDNEIYPSLWWLTAFIRQQIPITEQFAAFAQGAAGMGLTGPTGRGIIGFTFIPDTRTEIMIGLEGSSIMFQDINSPKFSSKIGLTYGVSVKF